MNQIEEIELNIVEAKKMTEMGKAIERLRRNPDFEKVILNGYLNEESVRLVHLKADPNVATPERQAAIVKQIDAIGSFIAFLNMLNHQAYLAEKAIQDDEEALHELRTGDAA